jgi:hypothetical protein
MIVMLDRPMTSIYGGTASAPIFRRIVQKTMTMMRLDDDTRTNIAASAAADSVIVPDVRGLDAHTADTVLRRLGLRLDPSHLTQPGAILRQQPAHGVKIERGASVRIETAAPSASGKGARPDVVGFPLRRAVTVLHGAGFEVKVMGGGRVAEQRWQADTCVLICR